MAENSWKTLPADRGAFDTLAASGLDYRVIDTSDPGVFDPYLQAEMRGFLSSEQSDDQLAGMREGLAFRRFIGVYDAASAEGAQPVGTVCSWVTDVTLPGGRGIPMWAISGVTVAPTHRRKGIARAMLEGELRTAAADGVAIAGLTVSEATIYGRFGFAPATFATEWSIDTRRALWIGPRPEGRLDFVSRETARDELAALARAACAPAAPVRSRHGRRSGDASPASHRGRRAGRSSAPCGTPTRMVPRGASWSTRSAKSGTTSRSTS